MTERTWWQRLTGRSVPVAHGRVTPDRLQGMFDYTLRTRVESIGISQSSVPPELCFILGISPTTRDIKSHKDAKIVHLPAYVSFSWRPCFAYVTLVDGMVRYHWDAEGHAALRECPETHDLERIRHIDAIFDYWEERIRRDLEAVDAAEAARAAVGGPADRSDPMALIRHYVEHGDAAYLNEVLGAPDTDDIILWVDWGEEDDRIVSECARILGLDGLSARFVEHGDAISLEVTRDGRVTMVDYDGPADRDMTLLALDRALRPDYELRYCVESGGSDTAAFLPLFSADWKRLERDYPDAVRRRFAQLSPDTPIFNR
ncbi:hypothetical protein G6M04_30320 [Agrobacterium rhizogenes]|uniref:hypothetical protein n=1 Tax=Rhizobium rhizogenes TaxID=359 RepID=UPI001571A32D|nr:hypothetical protein [Rhizobium rhizogenes]NTG51694.1 hypothetical protein [Rhizobium rhizogenes]